MGFGVPPPTPPGRGGRTLPTCQRVQTDPGGGGTRDPAKGQIFRPAFCAWHFAPGKNLSFGLFSDDYNHGLDLGLHLYLHVQQPASNDSPHPGRRTVATGRWS